MADTVAARRIIVWDRDADGHRVIQDIIEPWRACFWAMLVETRAVYGAAADISVERFERTEREANERAACARLRRGGAQ